MKLTLLTLVAAFSFSGSLTAQTTPRRALAPDPWVATDALGRSLPTAAQTRPARADRKVGVFYLSRAERPLN